MHLKKLVCLFIVMTLVIIFIKRMPSLFGPVFIVNKNTTSSSKALPSNIRTEKFNIIEGRLVAHDYLKGTLRSAGRHLTMYLHYKGDYISDNILTNHVWEGSLLAQFEDYIRTHPDIQVLDLGCNLGVYTLTAAALGCKVVAVDANPNNTARVIQSLLANNLNGRVTVCLNAVSNVRGNFLIGLNPRNIGSSNTYKTDRTTDTVNAIFIDDLIPLFDVRHEVAIKMDIETKEIDAMKRASRFFSERKVTLVLMEWEYIKMMADIEFVIDFFVQRQFKPFDDSRKAHQLHISNHQSWPWDIFWIK